MYSINMDTVPLVLEAYKELNLKHEPLRLITPEFETPLPPLQPAVSTESKSHDNLLHVNVKYLLYKWANY